MKLYPFSISDRLGSCARAADHAGRRRHSNESVVLFIGISPSMHRAEGPLVISGNMHNRGRLIKPFSPLSRSARSNLSLPPTAARSRVTAGRRRLQRCLMFSLLLPRIPLLGQFIDRFDTLA